MVIKSFPPVDQADEYGLLAVGGDLEVPSLKLAYSSGIFPWPVSRFTPLTWFSPDPRGLLFLDNYKPSRSFLKFLKKCAWEVTFNTRFSEVITECAISKNRKDAQGTWITNKMIQAYIDLHQAGHAYSVEVLDRGDLIGGMYGVHLGKFICGESMFYLQTNASKVAIHVLIEFLKASQVTWLDTQMVTPVIESLGGEELPREDFIELLQKSLPQANLNFPVKVDSLYPLKF